MTQPDNNQPKTTATPCPSCAERDQLIAEQARQIEALRAELAAARETISHLQFAPHLTT